MSTDTSGLNKLKESLPEIVKENKFALIGAAIGYFMSDDPKAQSAILGAVAGAVIGDQKAKKDVE